MVTPELRGLTSPDLNAGMLPADPRACCVQVDASIGPTGQPGAESFSFSVVTPAFLVQSGSLPRWGRGMLIVNEFSWGAVDRALTRLLSHASRKTWGEVAAALNADLVWEFDNYVPRGA